MIRRYPGASQWKDDGIYRKQGVRKGLGAERTPCRRGILPRCEAVGSRFYLDAIVAGLRCAVTCAYPVREASVQSTGSKECFL